MVNIDLNRRLKVLFITAWYPSKKYPVEGIFVREHAKAVQLYNDVVVLHCAGSDSKMKGLWRIEEEKDLSLTENITTYRVWFRLLPLRGINTFIDIYSVFRVFHWIIKRGFQPDIIHAHIFWVSLSAYLIGKIYGLPVVITEHSSAFPRKLLGWSVVLKAKFAFQRANIVLPVGKALQQGIEDYGIKANFAIVPNTVNTDLFYPNLLPKEQNDVKRLLFVGSLVPVKGVKYLFRALAMLLQYRDDWSLDLVGDNPSRPEYEQMVKELCLEKKITFHGIKSKFEVAEFMRQADFFVSPSLFETFGCVLIESMCCGLPIISTTAGEIPEIVPEFCGILAQPANSESLMQSINSVLSLDKQFNQSDIADFARRHYSYDSVGQRLNMIYQMVYDEWNTK